MATPITIDMSNTISRGNLSGIQRVCIEYYRALLAAGFPVRAVVWRQGGFWLASPHAVESTLHRNLHRIRRKRSASVWSLGGGRYWDAPVEIKEGEVVFWPEVFAPGVPAAAKEKYHCKTVAMFHDASVLHHPEWGVPKTLARFPGYMKELSEMDAVVTISKASAKELSGYFEFLECEKMPVMKVNEHGYDAAPVGFVNVPTALPRFLSLGTIEARKNHLSLFNACEELWNEGARFGLDVVGALAENGKPAMEKLLALKKEGFPIVWHGAASDGAVAKLWTTAWAFVYPSWSEGFGLPVVEALGRGIPVVCSCHAALAERVRHGGCEVVGQPTPEQIKEALSAILNPERRAKLAEEAKKFPKRNWGDAVREFLIFLKESGYEIAR